MKTTSNLAELRSILAAENGDPHHILGMHEIEYEGRACVAVRAFIPQASRVVAIDASDPAKQWELNLIHEDGFFECVIQERGQWFRYKLRIEAREGDTWDTYDPYSFGIALKEVDLYLFNQGTNYEVYNKLGAHPTVMDGVEGTLFAVWAPNARRVSVIGDFNTWDGRRHQMRLLKPHGVWELFVPGVGNFDKYKFEIKPFESTFFEKSDPFARFRELRPSTSSIVYSSDYKWNDAEWMEERVVQDPINGPMNIYEVHLGSWRHANRDGEFIGTEYEYHDESNRDGRRFKTYVELADELVPYLVEMNYTHVEIMPVCEHPLDASWGYQVTGFYAPTSRYGTPDEFRYFVDKCHQSGIGVILDWVPGHFPKDAHGLGRFDGCALFEHADPRQGEHREWGTYIFNYTRREVTNFLIANALYWIEVFHIDGIRVDAVASMLYLDFCKKEGEWVPNEYGTAHNIAAIEMLKHMNSIVQKRNPGALMIAEESTSWGGITLGVEHDGLGFRLKWNMGWMNDVLFYIAKEAIYRRYHHHNLTFASMYNHTERFVLVLSHDEVVHGKRSLLDKQPGDIWQKFAGLRVFLGFMYTHPGKKLLFMGGEFGQFIEWDEKRPLDWFLLDYPNHAKLHSFVKNLNTLYRHDRPLWFDDFGDGGFEWIQADDIQRSIVSFFRKTDDKDITIAVCNFTPEAYEDYRMGVPMPGSYREVLNSDHEDFGGSGVINSHIIHAEPIEWDRREHSVALRLPPLGMVILKPV